MLSYFRLRTINRAAALRTRWSCRRWTSCTPASTALRYSIRLTTSVFTRVVIVSDVSICLIERSCLKQWKQRPVSRQLWSANVSSWSIVTPRQVTAGRRSTTEPLATRTEPSTLASCYFVHHHHHRQPWAQCPLVSELLRAETRKLHFLGIQLKSVGRHPEPDIVDTRYQACKRCFTVNGLSSAYEWTLTPWRAAMTSTSVVYNRNRIGPRTLPCGTPYWTVKHFEY